MSFLTFYINYWSYLYNLFTSIRIIIPISSIKIFIIFKYFNFFADSLVDLGNTVGWSISRPVIDVILPVGISFYTFQTLSYTIDIYNDKVEEDGIIFFAQDIGANLIALATHGRSGLLHLLSGSIAEDIVNHAKRPVWTFRLKK